MTDDTLRVLEYDKIRALITGFTVSGPGGELARQLTPLSNESEVRAALSAAAEMATLLRDAGPPPVGGCCDLRPLLAELHAEGSWLPGEALLVVLASVEAAGETRHFLAPRAELPLLAAMAQELAPLKALRDEVRHCLGPRGELLDRASFALGETRREILNLRSRIRRTLESLLGEEGLAAVFQERLVTEREGRYVVPVRSDHRGRIKGFIHDESASGQTLFVEPVTILEANNDLQHQRREEKREEERILRRLADVIRGAVGEILANQALLAQLDLLAAVGRFARQSDAVVPVLVEEPLLDLRHARHPLLLLAEDGRHRDGAAVPVTLQLGPVSHTLVISGPNTGGKSVALKTAGLLVLMVRSGVPIPCHPDSRLFLFARVFADIGDEQSIAASLSTFSGHLTRIRRILAGADASSLVLLDEVGTGTDPAEGAALAMAILDALHQRGARTMVTTHLNLVKGYAQLGAGVENAAVEFDPQTLAPTYRLHYGIPGASNAFTIARQIGLDAELLARAEGYLGQGERDGLQVMEELNQLRRQSAVDLAEARRLRERARQEYERQRQLRSEFEAEKKSRRQQAANKIEEKVRAAEARLAALVADAGTTPRDARKRAETGRALSEIREEARSLREEPPRPQHPLNDTRPGEILRIPALHCEGEVVRVDGSEVELSVRGKKLRLALTALEACTPRRYAEGKTTPKVHGSIVRDSFQPRLLLVGKRVDEALVLLERFVDDALLQGSSELEIVHGAGEGILRRVVRDYLGGHRAVVSFHAADIAAGGENITIVGLREP
ncbi:MAG TPA: endonuclease MutS2 [Desulfuromonas sp.]|nr:endonuclease MutS2 [Desulfuromonas sp.]